MGKGKEGEILEEGLRKLNESFPEGKEKLLQFAILLYEYGRRAGLSGRKSLEDIVREDILDCAAVIPHMEGEGIGLDVGSGAGLPGVVIAILAGTEVHFLDSDRHACAFIQWVLEKLELRGEVYCGRAEELAGEEGLSESFGWVIGRAVAPLKKFCRICLPFLREGGLLYAMKGRRAPEEAEEAQSTIEALGGEMLGLERVEVPYLDKMRYIVKVRKLA